MRAMVYAGGLTEIDVPTPEPGLGQVRITVAAASVNPVDAVTAQGVLATTVSLRGSRSTASAGTSQAS